jgi:hypothetical protein
MISDRRGRVTGVRLSDGRELACSAAVLTTGTFLRGLIHIGEQQMPGRAGRARRRRSGLSIDTGAAWLCARPAQDRHAAAAGWRDDRLGGGRNAARRRPARAVLDPDRAHRDAADPVRHHAHHRRRRTTSSAPTCTARRCIPGRSRAAARAIAPRSRTRSCASASATGTRFPRARGPRRHDGLSERHLDLAARGRSSAR